MPKPGRRERKPSDEIARFTNRVEEVARVKFYLSSPTETPVLMFYGIGGAGKTWLLKKLRKEAAGLPQTYLDFDPQSAGQRFAHDPAAALYEIRQQIGREAPRFDLAYAMLRHKQGGGDEPGLRGSVAAEIVAEVAASSVPGVNVVLNAHEAFIRK